MQIKETLDVSFPGAVENPPLEDVVVLADSAGVALGVLRTFSARVRSVCDDGSGLIASRCVEISLVRSEGEVSGILCHRPAVRHAWRGRPSRAGEGEGDSGRGAVHRPRHQQPFRRDQQRLRLLKCQSDAAYRKAIVGKMQEAITRGALLSRQLLDAARPCPKSIGGSVAPLPSARARRRGPQQFRRHGDRLHAVTQRRRIPRRQPSDGCADVVAGANA